MDPLTQRKNAFRGVLCAGGAYVLWGIFPVFWRELKAVDATELIAHRVVWSLLFMVGLSVAMGAWGEVKSAFCSRKLLGLHLLSGGFLTLNWLTYVWSINQGRVLEMSLGYFLVPLLNVGLGRLVLREHLKPVQWCAISLAGFGVAIQFTDLRHLPWAGLTVAITWGVYGLMRKQSPLGSISGLTVETVLYTPLAGAFLLWLASRGGGAIGHVSLWLHVLVFSTGVVTAIPLILFAAGARRLRFTTIGLLQYISPSINFVIGILLYHEELTPVRIISFVLIWAALVVYSVDNVWGKMRS